MDSFAQQKLYMELQDDRLLILACSTRRNKFFLFWLQNPDL